MKTGRSLGFAVLALFVPSILGSAVTATATDLIAASQRGDLAQVRSLLDAGVDVDTRSAYGATALFFACDKGNLELARLLLARGADPELVDTFYDSSALEWALFKRARSSAHRAVLLETVRHLAESGDHLDDVLVAAVKADDLELASAIVEKGRISDDGLRSSLELARSASRAALVDYLASRQPPVEVGGFELPAARRSELLGHYQGEEPGSMAEVLLEAGHLRLRIGGGDPMVLRARSPERFGVLGVSGVEVRFEPAEGTARRLVWIRAERESQFQRVDPAAAEPAAQPQPAEPTPEAVAEGIGPAERTAPRPWPEFRGTGRTGIADGQGVPTTWDGPTGRNVVWKTPIPGLGLSSPVIWGDRVFVTAAVSESGEADLKTGLYGDVDSVEDDSVQSWRIYALDRATGEVLWEREASRGRPKVRRHLKSSHASPTPAVDASRLVVSFGSEGLFGYDHEGNRLWQRDLGTLSSGWFYDPTYEWEFASSPILWQDRVLVQVDIHGESFLAAFDAATGEEAWRTRRDEIPSWGTPVVLPAPGGTAEVVTNAKTIRGYDVATGQELWTLTPNSEITVASPVVADGTVFVTGGYPPARPIYALRPGGRGTLDLAEGETASAIIRWSTPRGGTYLPTPIAYRGRLYVLHNNGRLAAYDTTTGEEIYRQRVGRSESFSASPIAADGRLFFSSEDGTTYVARAGDQFEILSANQLDEVLMATPAAADGILVLRARRHVYGIAASEEPRSPLRE